MRKPRFINTSTAVTAVDERGFAGISNDVDVRTRTLRISAFYPLENPSKSGRASQFK
jgi:hypothetical protein